MTCVLYELVKNNDTKLSLNSACEAMGVSKSGYISHAKQPPESEELCNQIRAITNEYKRYGYRRVTEELKRMHILVNHKKVLKTMRKHDLLCKKRKLFVKTTDSEHGLPVYPNLAKNIEVVRLNQLWVADITYVQLANGFVYLAIILDVFSRKCIGWQLSTSIDAQLCIDALNMAFEERGATDLTDLMHHSDQGVQYASNEYTAALKERGIIISMSRRGNPYDNAFAESFMKTFKYEEVYMSEYESFSDALDNIDRFIERVYNQKRLHSSIGYMPPAEFEQQHKLKEIVA